MAALKEAKILLVIIYYFNPNNNVVELGFPLIWKDVRLEYQIPPRRF